MRSLLDEEEQPEIVGTITICLFVSYIGNPFKVDISLSVCILRFIHIGMRNRLLMSLYRVGEIIILVSIMPNNKK